MDVLELIIQVPTMPITPTYPALMIALAKIWPVHNDYDCAHPKRPMSTPQSRHPDIGNHVNIHF